MNSILTSYPYDETYEETYEETLMRIFTCVEYSGYHDVTSLVVKANKKCWNDEQIWDSYKDVPGSG
ncbi:hypothetical protein EBV26_15090, partial [bacterium]|nr:hypothetical protein [bacterium]